LIGLPVLVLISNKIIIKQRLGACNFLKCSSNTLILINYVMGSNIYSPSLRTILEAYANINLNNKQKHTDVIKMTNFDYIALYSR